MSTTQKNRWLRVVALLETFREQPAVETLQRTVRRMDLWGWPKAFGWVAANGYRTCYKYGSHICVRQSGRIFRQLGWHRRYYSCPIFIMGQDFFIFKEAKLMFILTKRWRWRSSADFKYRTNTQNQLLIIRRKPKWKNYLLQYLHLH